MYICVVKRLGRFGGVIHLVKGMRDSVNRQAFRFYVCKDGGNTCVYYSPLRLYPGLEL